MLTKLILSVFLLCTTGSAFAVDTNNDGVETILLPIAFAKDVVVNGAFGTQWRGEVWLRNEANRAATLQNTVGCVFNECSASYAAAFSGRVSDPLGGNPDGGLLLTPKAGDAPLLHFSNRMFEVTRHAQPQGVELPVVREDQFLKTSSTLLGVPTSSATRAAIRVYDPRRVEGNTVKIEVLGPDGNVLGATNLTTTFRTDSFDALLRPGFAAVYDLAALFPVANTVPYVHVRVTPVTPNAEYWVMVSVTDNDTQQVLLITPQ